MYDLGVHNDFGKVVGVASSHEPLEGIISLLRRVNNNNPIIHAMLMQLGGVVAHGRQCMGLIRTICVGSF